METSNNMSSDVLETYMGVPAMTGVRGWVDGGLVMQEDLYVLFSIQIMVSYWVVFQGNSKSQ